MRRYPLTYSLPVWDTFRVYGCHYRRRRRRRHHHHHHIGTYGNLTTVALYFYRQTSWLLASLVWD